MKIIDTIKYECYEIYLERDIHLFIDIPTLNIFYIFEKTFNECKGYTLNMNINNNLKSLIITLINNLYQDNQLNLIDYNLIDEYINQTPQERCPSVWNEIIKKTYRDSYE
jgi:hypothetical protein